MTRRQTEPPKQRGRKSKIAPLVFDFLARHKPGYYAATDPPAPTKDGDNVGWLVKQQTTKFFHGMTNLVMHKYGTDVDLEAPVEEDPPDPDEKLASVSPKRLDWTVDEKAAFDVKWGTLRRVRFLSLFRETR